MLRQVIRPFRALLYLVRWRSRRKAGRSVRVKVSDPVGFLARLDDAGHANVVMRWPDEVPCDPAAVRSFEGDVDVLVEDRAARRAAWIAAGMPGRVTIEFRSVTGRMGSYAGMPYYPPVLSDEVLERRVRHAKGFPIPAEEHRLPLVLFHLCYHKAESSGIPTGAGLPSRPAKRDYAAKLRDLAQSLGTPLPEPLTLTALDEELRRRGWDMQLDLLVRWPVRTPWIEHLTERARQRYASLAALAPELIVFVLRDQLSPELRERAVKRLSEWFDVLEHGELDLAQRRRCMRHMRGGDWHHDWGSSVSGPFSYVVCHDRAPEAPAGERARKGQPHVENARVFLKHRLRDELTEATGGSCRRTVHSSDNRHEAMHFLATIFADDVERKLREFAARARAPAALR